MIKNMKSRIKKKVSLLGLRLDYKLFIYMRLITSAILFVFLLFTIDYGYLVAPIATIVYYIFSEYVILNLGIKRRKYILETDALEFFPIFLLALKSGNNIKNALKISVELVDNELSQEFKLVLRSIEAGKSLDESLNLLNKRIPSQIIANIILSVIEAKRHGNTLNNTINNQLSYIKERQKKDILIKYKSISFKIALISIAFVFTSIVLLIIFNYYL